MFKFIRQSYISKVLAVFLSLFFIFDVFNPKAIFALGGGPSQPEVESFEPIGTTDMVDIFTGDFTYNIPLLDVGGYPINISYHSGVSMDQEASWVGLGWNINPGVINRGMRGIPDDFNGDQIKKEFYVKPNRTYGLSVQPGAEVFGIDPDRIISLKEQLLSYFSFGVNYNNYRGVGMEFNSSIGGPFKGNKSKLNWNLGFSAGTNGVGINPNLSFTKRIYDQYTQDVDLSPSIGLSFNNRSGVSALNLGIDMAVTNTRYAQDKDNKLRAKVVSSRESETNGGTSISFATPSFTPQIQMPMVNTSLNFRATLGFEFFSLHGEAEVNGYFSSQALARTEENVASYGYLYLDQQEGNPNILMDYTREKDGGFSEYTPALPITVLSYDTYSVSGQGIGGTYRPYRGSVGIVTDKRVMSDCADISFAQFEVGGGNAVHTGTNFHTNFSSSTSGRWSSGNNLEPLLSFKTPESAASDYEKVYFKQAGEKTLDEDQLYEKIGKNEAVNVKIDNLGKAYPIFEKSSGNININNTFLRTQRAKRNEVISYLTADEASKVGMSTKIKTYPFNNFTYTEDASGNWKFSAYPLGGENRTNSIRKGHHISEISVARADGTRYIYGIPAYNKSQTDLTFAIDGVVATGSAQITKTIEGTTSYTPNQDAKIKNGNGMDQYYSKDLIPAYAHSYLLTQIVSADYSDIDNNGFSPNDPGTYVNFNYSRIDNYKWKVPYEENTANYNEGLRSDVSDDKASVISGTKELYYLHSIETKTHIAIFYTSDRQDSKEAGGETVMKKLDKIELYSRNDYIKCTEENITPTPIKTVHFSYSYELCENIDNRTTSVDGKLTLKSIWFTYGKSEKGSLNKYEFNYGDFRSSDGSQVIHNCNPDYDLKCYDRWGSYQFNTPERPCAVYPYTDQSKISYNGHDVYLADYFSTAWNMTSINLPGGGKINIDYESDEYAFVQDRRAMEMFKVVGVISEDELGDSEEWSTDRLYSGAGLTPGSYRNIVVVKIPQHYAQAGITMKDLVGGENGGVLQYIYFKFMIDVGALNKNYEYVSGYAEFDKNSELSFIDVGDPNVYTDDYAYIALKSVKSNDNIQISTSPIVQAALNFTIIHMPRIAYNQPDPTANGILPVVQALISTVSGITQFIGGTDRMMVGAGKCSRFVPSESQIRLCSPLWSKKGGGSRVKRVLISDEWQSSSPLESSSKYGQEYNYQIEKNGKTYSSGVATYEPGIGADENPFRQPVPYSDERFFAPDLDFYMEEPFGESFFPAPMVGYSKVQVTNYLSNSSSISKTGRTEYEFYTAKDFPTKVRKTLPVVKKDRSNPVINLFKLYMWDNLTASQGYSVELNDMHGKPKSVSEYSEGGNRISGTEYIYKKESLKTISNTASVITPEGKLQEDQTIGIDYDFVVDMRENKTNSFGFGITANLDGFLALFFPLVVPVVLPSVSGEDVRFRSVVTTKVINRYGLIDSIYNYQDGASFYTKNLAYDSETGEVLLTKTSNEFYDDYYSFTYPAHWFYQGMGQAYKNIGYTAEVSTNNGVFTNTGNYFVHGDEILSGIEKFWVLEENGVFRIIDFNGNNISDGTHVIKVIRSGRKNIQNVSVGSVLCREFPFNSTNDLSFGASSKIIQATASELTDETLLACQCYDLSELPLIYNPFVRGKLNNWRKLKDYTFLTQREYSSDLVGTGYNTDIQNDGAFEEFIPFWSITGTVWVANNTDPWIWVSEVTKYSNNGTELENKDALGIFKSAMYGYLNTKLTAISNNAKFNQMGFDGFEDYDLNSSDCNPDHFSFRHSFIYNGSAPVNGSVTDEESHSGQKCIKVLPGKTVNMVRKLTNCE